MVNNSLIRLVKPDPVLKTTILSENHWSKRVPPVAWLDLRAG